MNRASQDWHGCSEMNGVVVVERHFTKHMIGTFWFFYNHKIIKMYHVLLLKQSFRFYLTAWTSSSYFESQFDLITKKLNLFGFMANEQFRLTIFDLAFFKRWTHNSKNHLDFLTKLD